MPRDFWRQANQKRKARRDGYARQAERESQPDAADRWLAWMEKKPRRRKKR